MHRIVINISTKQYIDIESWYRNKLGTMNREEMCSYSGYDHWFLYRFVFYPVLIAYQYHKLVNLLIEKERQIVSYSIATPEKMEKKKSSFLKKFWSDAISCKITLDYDGKGSTIEWEKKGFIPYERKAERVKYLEVVQEGLDVSFISTKIVKK